MTERNDAQDDRDVASTILRGIAAGATTVGSLVPNPIVEGAALGTSVILNLVASLVENVGRNQAEAILAELVGHPAQPITTEQLAADVARIKAEFGIGTPPNPY